MLETPDELAQLQRLLTDSHRASTVHLRSIITGNFTLTAEEMARALTGMRTINLATVTASGEPRISAVDGHFLHGRWVFTTTESAAKTRHLRARPAASISYVDGERVAVFTHGHVEFLPPDHPELPEIEEYLIGHYGSSPTSWGEGICTAA